MAIESKIRKLRIEIGLTQKELGAKCGIDEANIRKYESGKQKPKIDTLKKIADALGVQITDIMDFSDMPVITRSKQITAATESHTAVMEERTVFLDTYENRLNDRGKHKVHEYTKDLAKNSDNLKQNKNKKPPDVGKQ